MARTASEIAAMAGVRGPVGTLSPELCWSTLEESGFGRLAVTLGDDVDIFPINFVVDGTKIYFRTAPGSKLDAVTQNSRVAVEVDGVDDTAAYSVVVKGRAERLEAPSEIAKAEALDLKPWIPTLKLRWVRIQPAEVSGRAFHRGEEPQHYV
ncbi:MAG TPA: pyridoxamine 5'-phosphate oxidase family protein [Pseudolysinimonas sp.]|jgi:nitroimidazol reductase NimA-like FMN-containing flavoprotein (pyridoxamine 5'-phosphate oxidase superfamily)|nr:pyridoxamine 5'-phosphate oxidase family protein [Pseudolysinimonas sp.]